MQLRCCQGSCCWTARIGCAHAGAAAAYPPSLHVDRGGGRPSCAVAAAPRAHSMPLLSCCFTSSRCVSATQPGACPAPRLHCMLVFALLPARALKAPGNKVPARPPDRYRPSRRRPAGAINTPAAAHAEIDRSTTEPHPPAALLGPPVRPSAAPAEGGPPAWPAALGCGAGGRLT